MERSRRGNELWALGWDWWIRPLSHNWGLSLSYSILSRGVLKEKEEEKSYFQEKKALLVLTLIDLVSENSVAWAVRTGAVTVRASPPLSGPQFPCE